MDSKIILNLLGRRRRVTSPLLNRFLQNPHLRSAHYSAELVSTESHSPELPYSRLTPCLDLNAHRNPKGAEAELNFYFLFPTC